MSRISTPAKRVMILTTMVFALALGTATVASLISAPQAVAEGGGHDG
jgi:hypothetical protein